MTAVARVALPTTTPAPPAAAVRTAAAPRTGYLRLVPQRRTAARRAPFVAVVVGLLAAGLLGLLVLNTALAEDAFRLHSLQVQGKQLDDREQELSTTVEDLEAPRALAERAAALHMVPGGPPAFLSLPDGRISGLGAPGQAPTPSPVPGGAATPQDAAAQAEADASSRADQAPATSGSTGDGASGTDATGTDGGTGTGTDGGTGTGTGSTGAGATTDTGDATGSTGSGSTGTGTGSTGTGSTGTDSTGTDSTGTTAGGTR
ncbi:MAG: Septum formation initiator [Frankiales bacterium]|nr:Septum formation initiator [Frankiales bacterium]